MWKPTGELRWVERDHPHGGTDTFLQQRWWYAVSAVGKWKDVPTIKEK